MKKHLIGNYFVFGLVTILALAMLQPSISGHLNTLSPSTCTSDAGKIVRFEGVSTKKVMDCTMIYSYKKDVRLTPSVLDGTNILLTDNTYYDGHPTLTDDGLGNLMVNYERGDVNQSLDIGMHFSKDGGALWDGSHYHWLIPYKETRPDIDYVSSQRTAIGTLVPDPTFNNGGVATFIIYPDIVDPNAQGKWICQGGDLTKLNITHVTSAAVGGYVGDPKPDPKFKGIWAFTADFGTRHTVVLCSDLAGVYKTDVFPDVQGNVDNISADIDISTGKMVLAMDDNNDAWGPGILILCSNITTDWSWWEVATGTFFKSYKNPDVKAINGEIYVVAQKEGKIYSLISNSTTGNFNVRTVCDHGGYPAVATDGHVVHCIAVDSGNINLYKSEAGQNWTFVKQINTVDGKVTADYKTSDVCGEGIVWTDTRDGDSNVYFEPYTLGQNINIDKIKGGFGCSITVSSIASSQMTNVPWTISFNGSVFLGKEKSGTIGSLSPGGTAKIRSGFVLGAGKATIIVKVEQAIAAAKCFVIGPFILLSK